MTSNFGHRNASPGNSIDGDDPRLILLILAKFLCFMFGAIIFFVVVAKHWTNSGLRNDHMLIIIVGYIVFGPLIIISLLTFARLFAINESRRALRSLSTASVINLLTIFVFVQWLGTLAFYAGLIVGAVVFLFLSYHRRFFRLCDYIGFSLWASERSLLRNIWLIAGWFHIVILASVTTGYFVGIVESVETLAVIFLGAALCLTACQFILLANSMLIQRLSASDRVWLPEEHRVYEKLIQLFWHLGTGVMATIFFLIPLASFTLPLEKRQIFIDSGWFLCVLYWLGLFITPAYVLISSHRWNRRLIAHIRATAIGSLTFALFGIYVQNVQGGIIGTIIGLTLGAFFFSIRTHIRARGQYESWMPESEGRGFPSLIFLVMCGILIIPVTIEDVFIAGVFASYSIIILCLVFSYRLR